ncbi:glycine/D-amino acid oxidase-like deaminating enzyme [Winogradskyella eximia]|jgi:glycine oxidase|uniref:Glycine/D-amino acid oxidase-like deaminating enzyme n=1 Tax=Winogradskyella eximia TaxID=262006 RepID=A0A3D9HD77_9FLAO|nr:FAD-binding oxidoreductase [Winogradskyella eximia]RED47221.1 glycine/D-amino acid oxidase-like deaminating enzyme [Winogradskyella eximia]|tara:strand:+ start:495 stop:1538 length:1044 start_codon:yes stop_codon:yes gene_type:complete
MKEVDYIIVGCGLASIAFCEELRGNNKTFVVFDNNSQKSSIVAAGLYNPVILKRFSEVWKAKEQLNLAALLYSNIEKELDITVDYKLRILRRFTSIQEQNKWFSASDKPSLEPFLSTQLVKNTNLAIDAPFGFGEVQHAGRLDTETLITNYKQFLKRINCFEEVTFEHQNIKFELGSIHYNGIKSQHIVFAEGFGVKENPYFKTIPLTGSKGEILTIKAPDLKIDYAIKSSVFVIPLGDDLYNVGSTYNNDDKSNTPTESAKEELISKLKTFLKCDFEVVSHIAGVRPTVKDRRPLIGRHPKHNNLYVLNGLGTRGVMIAPYVAKALYNFIEKGELLDAEIDVNRFL